MQVVRYSYWTDRSGKIIQLCAITIMRNITDDFTTDNSTCRMKIHA